LETHQRAVLGHQLLEERLGAVEHAVAVVAARAAGGELEQGAVVEEEPLPAGPDAGELLGATQRGLDAPGRPVDLEPGTDRDRVPAHPTSVPSHFDRRVVTGPPKRA